MSVEWQWGSSVLAIRAAAAWSALSLVVAVVLGRGQMTARWFRCVRLWIASVVALQVSRGSGQPGGGRRTVCRVRLPPLIPIAIQQ